MSVFGLAVSEVTAAVRAVTRDLEPGGAAERFALAAWSCIAEPGDRDAGLLVAGLGASAALTEVIAATPPDRLAAALREQSGERAQTGQLASALDRWRPRLRSATVLHAVREAARLRVRMLTRHDPDWCEGLDDLGPHAPHVLWLRGTDAALHALRRSIAMVGARAATGYGEHVAAEASAGLVERGFAVVSGAAYGIDGTAHRVALATGGHTIAFLAGGVDRAYPSGHEALLSRIAESGLVAAEVPCGTAPTKWRFLQRNRLIAAASQATVVLEAGRRSGSLNTAGHAAALGRPLGAVPGPVTSPASAGCHRLIREYDAALVTGPDEMAALHPDGGRLTAGTTADADPDADTVRVIDALSLRSARSADDIAERSGLAVSRVRGVLGVLELDGAVIERPAGGWVRVGAAPR